MKLVQKILSHGLLIAFIVAAFFTYTNRAELFPRWFGKTEQPEQQVTTTTPDLSGEMLAERKVSRPLPEKTVSKTPVAPVDETPQGATEETGTPSAQIQPPVAEPKTPLPKVPEKTDAPTEPSAQVQPAEPVIRTSGTAETQTEVAEAESPQVAALQAARVDQAPASPQQPAASADARFENMLEEARQYYWKRDLSAAMAAYQALAKAYPQNPDVWGEMGNFYYNMHQNEPAGAAYSRCVELLIDQGETTRARQLLNVLYRLDTQKARALETRIQQAGD
jgi:hypothetical protein